MTAGKQVQQVVEIPLGELFVSREEIRKTMDDRALAELAESIRVRGVVEALLVRPGRADSGVFEIVAGQRRWLASKAAGKTTCPCVVRALTDDQARELRILSNLQREDLAPMEEAEAYGKLLELPGATVETVAAALAKAPSYVGRRVQLLKAIEPVREALRAGAIEVGHALELARLDEALQRGMLSRLGCGVDEEGEEGTCRFCERGDEDENFAGWANEEKTICEAPRCLEQFRVETEREAPQWHKTYSTVADLKRQIEETAYRDLRDAPFPLAAKLAPMACTDCPKRAGNALLLFDDCAQDTCTDRRCFNRKVEAWIEAELAAAAAETRKLLELTDRWTDDIRVVYVSDYGDTARLLRTPDECEHGEEGIWIVGRNAGRRAQVCRKKKCAKHHGRVAAPRGSVKKTETDPKELRERKDLLAKVAAEKAYRTALFDAIGAVKALSLVRGRPTAHRVLAARVAEYVFRRSDSTRYADLARATKIPIELFRSAQRAQPLRDHFEGIDAERLMVFAAMAIAASELCVYEHDVPCVPGNLNARGKQRKLGLEELAELVGLDWKALRKQGEAAEKPEREPSGAVPLRPSISKARAKPAKAAKKPARQLKSAAKRKSARKGGAR